MNCKLSKTFLQVMPNKQTKPWHFFSLTLSSPVWLERSRRQLPVVKWILLEFAWHLSQGGRKKRRREREIKREWGRRERESESCSCGAEIPMPLIVKNWNQTFKKSNFSLKPPRQTHFCGFCDQAFFWRRPRVWTNFLKTSFSRAKFHHHGWRSMCVNSNSKGLWYKEMPRKVRAEVIITIVTREAYEHGC